MYSILEKKLGKFFLGHSISHEVGMEMFEKWLVDQLEQSGIKKIEKGCFTLQSSKPRYEDDNNIAEPEKIMLKINGLDWKGLEAVLAFYHIPRESYRTDELLPVNQEYFFQVILARFKEHVSHLSEAKKLRSYHVESQHELESSAVGGIAYFAKKYLDDANSAKTSEKLNGDVPNHLRLSLNGGQLTVKLSAILSIANRLENGEYQYAELFMDLHKDLKNFLLPQSPAFQENKSLQSLLACFVNYETFNRVEVVRKVKKFQESLTPYFKQYGMTPNCGVFQDLLFEMAGIETPPESEDSGFRIDSDRTRYYFYAHGMSDNDVDKLITFFSKWDDSACKIVEKPNGNEGCSYFDRAGPNKRDMFGVDGECLATHIFPVFKDKFESLLSENPSKFDTYRESSRQHFQYLTEQAEKEKAEAEEKIKAQEKMKAEKKAIKANKNQSLQSGLSLFQGNGETGIGGAPVTLNNSYSHHF